jgi:DNA (cytosine-5)-methyltransferase 1
MKSVELFAGAGGLALGTELAGFRPELVVEWDQWACDTIRHNQARDYPLVRDWKVFQGDVRGVDWADFEHLDLDLVSGGPPCQPFSLGGKHMASDDNRDMFPASVAVVRRLKPRAFIFENVRGLTREAFSNYFQYILLQLSMPEIVSRERETWTDHLKRLQSEQTGTHVGLRYNVLPTLVNSADYGVPQQRHRVIIVGFRSDIDAEWSFPGPTHSKDSLLYDQWVSGTYWAEQEIPRSQRPKAPTDAIVRRLRRIDRETAPLRWRTVRDALKGLPRPRQKDSGANLNHVLQLGARPYSGHTGSPVDLPAKALKAGGHGVPGGENMMVMPDGSVRYFTVRESARLQTFPDRYELRGAWGEAMRQLGNAVPVILAQRVAGSVAEHLAMSSVRSHQLGTQRKMA